MSKWFGKLGFVETKETELTVHSEIVTERDCYGDLPRNMRRLQSHVKEDLIRNNNSVNWIPESIGKGRFGDWLENIQDWGISRNRYWGTPLPVWDHSRG